MEKAKAICGKRDKRGMPTFIYREAIADISALLGQGKTRSETIEAVLAKWPDSTREDVEWAVDVALGGAKH
jgi:hypothetical protein